MSKFELSSQPIDERSKQLAETEEAVVVSSKQVPQETPESKKEKNPFHDLDIAVQHVNKIRELVERTGIDTPEKEVRESFEKLDLALNDFIYGERQATIRKYRTLLEQQRALLEHNVLDPKDPKNLLFTDKEIEAKYIETCKHIDAIESRPDITFIQKMRQLHRSLVDKHAEVRSLRNNPKTLARNFRQLSGIAFDESKIQSTHFDGFGVTFILDSDYAQKIFDRQQSKDALGMHLRGKHGSVISIVSGDAISPVEVMQHEAIHNMLDGQDMLLDEPRDVFEQDYEELEVARNTTEHESDSESFRRARAAFLKKNSRRYLDAAHEEILAHLEGEEMVKFLDIDVPTRKESGVPVYEGRKTEKRSDYATAAQQIGELSRYMLEVAVEESDTEVQKKIHSLLQNVVEDFREVFYVAISSLRAGKQMGREAWFDVHALTYLLKPSQYKHIPTFMKHKYKDAYEKASLWSFVNNSEV